MGPPGLLPQDIFCDVLCIFTNNINASVLNSSASIEGAIAFSILHGSLPWALSQSQRLADRAIP